MDKTLRDARKQAEMLALQALGWIAADDAAFLAFQDATGADAAMIRDSADDPGFLGGVLDFLMQDDSRVTGFCDAQGLAYDAPMQARAALPGGADPHWT